MRSLRRVLSCAAVLIVCAFVDRAASFMQFGAAVLVGDREVFAGEPANYARPGTVSKQAAPPRAKRSSSPSR